MQSNVSPMTVQRLLSLRRLFTLALLLVLGASPALAQNGGGDADLEALKSAYSEGVQAAKNNNAEVAYAKLAEARRLAQQADQPNAAQQISDILFKLPKKWGNEALKADDTEAALMHFNKGIELDPEEAYFYYGKALAQLKAGSRDEGIATMAQAAEVGEAHGDRKTARLAQERIRDEFVSEASQALQDPPRPQRALEALEAMTEYVEMDASAYLYQGIAYYEQGNYQQAITAIDQGLEMHRGSKSQEARYHLVKGESQLRLGNTQSACQSFREATFGETKPRAEHHLENDCAAR
jgi:tetratricopeptide (TPR) repeat protein